ncbi:MAG: hypothetical protein GY765_09855 [bacterium]|nr:hypothetical protein [bacterium]
MKKTNVKKMTLNKKTVANLDTLNNVKGGTKLTMGCESVATPCNSFPTEEFSKCYCLTDISPA